jgi:hypothetical protein
VVVSNVQIHHHQIPIQTGQTAEAEMGQTAVMAILTVKVVQSAEEIIIIFKRVIHTLTSLKHCRIKFKNKRMMKKNLCKIMLMINNRWEVTQPLGHLFNQIHRKIL